MSQFRQAVPPKELRAVLPELLSQGDEKVALLTLSQAIETVREQSAWCELRRTTQVVPPVLWQQFDWAVCYARILLGERAAAELLTWVPEMRVHFDEAQQAALNVFLAWAHLMREEYAQSMDILRDSIPLLDSSLPEHFTHGFAWRCLGEAAFELREQDWQQHFNRAHALLKGRALALSLITAGSCHERCEAFDQALQAWKAALILLPNDIFHQAWIHHALGTLHLSQPDQESLAEKHFLQAVTLSRQRRAAPFQARAQCGLGSVYRLQGDWQRAENSYRAALKAAQEMADRKQALWGLGQCLRQAGKPLDALPYYYQALLLNPLQDEWVYVGIAAAYLQAGSVPAAKLTLEQATQLNERELWRVELLKAELFRRENNQVGLQESLHFLTQVQQRPILRLELRAFPELLALLRVTEAEQYTALEPQVMRVEVKAIGVLKVKVNGQAVPFKPNSRLGELLVYLLECGHQGKFEVSYERLISDLYPQYDGSRESWQKSVNSLLNQVKRLQSHLGWPQSVTARRGMCRLDPQTQWHYDVTQALVERKTIPIFLDGNYGTWAKDREAELRAQSE